jgi:hypothetical protein
LYSLLKRQKGPPLTPFPHKCSSQKKGSSMRGYAGKKE